MKISKHYLCNFQKSTVLVMVVKFLGSLFYKNVYRASKYYCLKWTVIPGTIEIV